MQGIYNNIYDNVHNIIGWDPNEGKKNVERGTEVTADASDIGTGGGSMSQGEVNMVKGTYLHTPIRL